MSAGCDSACFFSLSSLFSAYSSPALCTLLSVSLLPEGSVSLWMPLYRFSVRSQTPPAPRDPVVPLAPAAAGCWAGRTMRAMPPGPLGTPSTTTPASPLPSPSSSLPSTQWSSLLAWWETVWSCLSS